MSKTKSILFYIKRLKTKGFFSSQNTAVTLSKSESQNTIHTLKSHYLLERQNVNTTEGVGNTYTPLTHHDNEVLPDELKNNHLIKSPPNKTTVHPDGKTSTISNSHLFVKKTNLVSKDSDLKAEFSNRPSMLKRIDEDNFLEHYKHHCNVVKKDITNVFDNTTTKIINEEELGIPVKVLKKEDHLEILFEDDPTKLT